MKNKSFILLTILCFATFLSCSQTTHQQTEDTSEIENPTVNENKQEVGQHNYGGWFCPDNLNGFPAVDIKNWQDVPVINGRMATKEETQSESSLLFIDLEKYPNAKPLDIEMPKLARYYNISSRKEEIIIVIQALNIQNDSIVGFRFLNGGNGSAQLSEVKFLSDSEIEKIPSSHFVSFEITINANQNKIWEILTKPEYSKYLQPIFDPENTLNADWNKASKVNFSYFDLDNITAKYAANLYGNQYIQIDCELDDYQYVEKFLLLENKQTNTTVFKIVCGPYGEDYENQKLILNQWAEKVKELSEKE